MDNEEFRGKLARLELLIGAILLFILLVLPNCFGWPLRSAVELSSSDGAMPEGTVFVDLLVKSDADDRYYTELNSANAERYLTAADCDIVSYADEDGFVSYTFHIIDSSSAFEFYDRGEIEGAPSRSFKASFGEGISTAMLCSNHEILGKYTDSLKTACVDKDGEVLYVSDEFKLRPTDFFFTLKEIRLNQHGARAVREPKPAMYFPLLAVIVLTAFVLMIRAYARRRKRR